MLKYTWLLTALLSGLINFFKFELQEVHAFTSHLNLLSWRSQVQIFWGFTVNFLAIWLLTVNYNSSFWDLRLIWVIFENNSEIITQMYICFINAKKRKETSGISLFCSLIIVEIWVYNIMSTFEIWILHQSQSHGQESDFWKWERNKLI